MFFTQEDTIIFPDNTNRIILENVVIFTLFILLPLTFICIYFKITENINFHSKNLAILIYLVAVSFLIGVVLLFKEPLLTIANLAIFGLLSLITGIYYISNSPRNPNEIQV